MNHSNSFITINPERTSKYYLTSYKSKLFADFLYVSTSLVRSHLSPEDFIASILPNLYYPEYANSYYDSANFLNSSPESSFYKDHNYWQITSHQLSLSSSFFTSDLNKKYRQAILPSEPHSLYPIATRYITSNGYYIIERPPFQVPVNYKPAKAHNSTKKKFEDFSIWIPWTIFIFNPSNLNSFKLYFSSKSLSTMDDKYIPTYLPNTWSSGEICFSNSLGTLPEDSLITTTDSSSPNISALYSLIINEFFAGGWNADIQNNWSRIFANISIYYSHFYKHYKKAHPDLTSEECYLAVLQELHHMYPNLMKLFNISKDQVHSSVIKRSTIRQSFNYTEQLQSQNYHSLYIPHNILSPQDIHLLIISRLSTFTLSETLSLIEEAVDFTSNDYKYNIQSFGFSKSFSDIIKEQTRDQFRFSYTFSDNIHYAVNSASTAVSSLENSQIEFNFLSPIFYNPHYLATPKSYMFNANTSLTLDPSIQIQLFNTVLSHHEASLDLNKIIYTIDSNNSIKSYQLLTDINSFYISFISNNFDINNTPCATLMTESSYV